jgi:hypothetical protein
MAWQKEWQEDYGDSPRSYEQNRAEYLYDAEEYDWLEVTLP